MRALVLLMILTFSPILFANNFENSNALFDYAEKKYPQYFSPAGSQTFEIDYLSKHYIARHYKETETYIGTVGEDVFIYGDIWGGLLKVGVINDFIDKTSYICQVPIGHKPFFWIN